jgi:hypothetical protein
MADPKKPANKISKFESTGRRALERKINRIQNQIIKNEVRQADIIDKARENTDQWRKDRKGDRHQLKNVKHKNRLRLNPKLKRSRPTIRFEKAPLGSFERKIGVGRQTFGTGVEPFDPTKPDIADKIKSRSLKDKLVETGKKLTKNRIEIAKKTNQLRNLNRSRYLWDTLAAGANEFPGQTLAKGEDSSAAKRFISTNNVVKVTRLGVGALKTVKHLGVGLALNYLSDRYLVPHAERLGTKLGEALVPLGREIDRKLERRKK